MIIRTSPNPQPETAMIRVLFVCLGNICRSPIAEGVFRARVAREGLAHAIATDSAGTHDYHIGDPPDSRATAAAKRRGVDISDLRGRQVTREDFVRFDYVPDPYYGGQDGFERVLDLAEAAAEGLLAHILSAHLAGPDGNRGA